MRLAALAVLAGPLLGYPLYVGALVAADLAGGERLFAYQARFEQRQLLDAFLADYEASLPMAVLVAAALVVLAVTVRRYLGPRLAVLSMLLGGATIGLVAASALTGGVVNSAGLALGAAGAGYGAVLAALSAAWLRNARPEHSL